MSPLRRCKGDHSVTAADCQYIFKIVQAAHDGGAMAATSSARVLVTCLKGVREHACECAQVQLECSNIEQTVNEGR